MNTTSRVSLGAAGLLVAALASSACAKEEPAPAAQSPTSAAPQGPPWRGGAGRGGRGGGAGAGPHMGCPNADGPLSDAARVAVERALTDERDAEAKYEGVVQALGPVMPFRQFQRAERRHAWALEQLLTSHSAVVPAAPAADTGSRVASLRDACVLGVESEKRNIALYDELLKGDLPADVRCVFGHLQGASKERHLPVFTDCAK